MRGLQFTTMGLAAMVLAGCGISCEDGRSTDVVALPPATDDAEANRSGLAIEFVDDEFPEFTDYGDVRLVLNGSGLCEWGFFGIDLYQAALYVERKVADQATALAADQVMVVHLDFVRSLTTAQLREAYSVSTKANAGDRFADYEAALTKLLDTMSTVQAGESYTFVADPARGLVVQREDRELATIADDGFRQLFVRLYLGDQPPTKALRKALMGGGR